MSDIDEYIAKVAEPQRTALASICQEVRTLAPDAQETISYGMPTFKYKGKSLIHFAAFTHHMSVFPTGRTELFKDRLEGYETGKGTIQFTIGKPLPEGLVGDIVRSRLAEIDATGR